MDEISTLYFGKYDSGLSIREKLMKVTGREIRHVPELKLLELFIITVREEFKNNFDFRLIDIIRCGSDLRFYMPRWCWLLHVCLAWGCMEET